MIDGTPPCAGDDRPVPTGLHPVPGAVCTYLDGEALLFDPRRRAIHRLSKEAGYVWALLEQGETATGPTGEAMDRLPGAATDMLASFQTLGLLAPATVSMAADGPRVPENEGEDEDEDAAPRRLPAGTLLRSYEIAATTITVSYGDADLMAAAAPLLKHLERPPPAGCGGRLDVVRTGRRILIGVNGRAVVGCGALDEVAPLLLGTIAAQVLRADHVFLGIHGAALARGGKGLLLAGSGGSGKSTLAAALAGAGWDYLGDDIAFVDHRRLLQPAALPICVKAGGLAVAQQACPGFEVAGPYRRYDGREVRYLLPGNERQPAAAAVRWLVFPSYHPGMATRLRPLDRVSALMRLLDHLHEPVADGIVLRRMGTWISTTACFELTVSDLEQATAILEALAVLPQDRPQ